MKLRYTVSMDDVMVLNHFFYRNSSTIRRSRLTLVIGLPGALMAAAKAHSQTAARRTQP